MSQPFDDKSEADHDAAHVGQTSPDDSFDIEESGAEARTTRDE